MAQFGAWLYVVMFLLAVALAICWIVLPFAVIGTKPLLRELLREARRTNELLERAQGSSSTGTRYDREPVTVTRDFNRVTQPEPRRPEPEARPRFAGSPDLPPV